MLRGKENTGMELFELAGHGETLINARFELLAVATMKIAVP
jgi:hypothetical protein